MAIGRSLLGAAEEHASGMRVAGLDVAGTLSDLLGADLVVDCTPKRVAARNIDVYRLRGLKRLSPRDCIGIISETRVPGLGSIRAGGLP